MAQIASSLGGFIVDVIGDNQTGRFESNAKLRATQLRRNSPSSASVRQGGQALSTRPDLLPAQYLDELTTLQDALPTFSDADAFETVEAELGSRWRTSSP